MFKMEILAILTWPRLNVTLQNSKIQSDLIFEKKNLKFEMYSFTSSNSQFGMS